MRAARLFDPLRRHSIRPAAGGPRLSNWRRNRKLGGVRGVGRVTSYTIDEGFFRHECARVHIRCRCTVKRKEASQLITQRAAAGEVMISTQVVQEFYVTVTGKLAQPLAKSAALAATRELTASPPRRTSMRTGARGDSLLARATVSFGTR